MSNKERYIIDYQGLSNGGHSFDFVVDDSLAQQCPESEIKHAKGSAHIDMIRHTSMLELTVSIAGELETECDRCLEDFWLPFAWQSQVMVKIVEEKGEDDADILWVTPAEKLDLTQYLYESIVLSLPIVRHHASLQECNPEMISKFTIEQ